MPKTRTANLRALAFVGVGFEFAAIVGVIAFGGYRLDLALGSQPWALVAGCMIGVAIAVWILVRSVSALENLKNIEKNEGRGG